MNRSYKILGFDTILEQLNQYTSTAGGKDAVSKLEPFLSELELRKNLRDTTEAKRLLELLGNPPIPAMEQIEKYVIKSVQGELIDACELESIGSFLAAVKRMKDYLYLGSKEGISLAFYYENLEPLEFVRESIMRCIRGGKIDDYASNTLRDIRRDLLSLEDKIKQKAEGILKTYKSFMAESFVVTRNGSICVPVKSQYKQKVKGSVIDKSSTGSTLFIEPDSVARLRDDYELLKIEEDTEERRILYELLDMVANEENALYENIRILEKLDFIFAKGKLSIDMKAVEPTIVTESHLYLKEARHPMINRDACVPLTLELGGDKRGMIITGPNTGGKTVAIKTVGLFNLMACAGLHVPCEAATIGMRSQVLCDIGDGQNVKDNLSTFSSHITNVISILKKMNEETLVILDELGSGTDPQEGMGIAIAILEEIRKSGCLFLVTTHYPEVKNYAGRHEEILNARMAFDRDELKPLYRLEVGQAGESCALYIAKRLGMPEYMLDLAAREAYGADEDKVHLDLSGDENQLKKEKVPRIKKQQIGHKIDHKPYFTRGDSVEVGPDHEIGIVVTPENEKGEMLVQVKKEKVLVNKKRVKLKVRASELYPEDYDFSIIFDTVEVRKARHTMERKYEEGMEIRLK